MQQHHILWPERFKPADHPIHSYNELRIAASPEAIWQKLIDARHWPDWYPNSQNVRIDGPEPALTQGSRFVWETFGVTVKSRVLVCEPFSDLGWDAEEMLGWRGFHGWKIIPQDGACLVVTEEVQNGVAATLIKSQLRKKLLQEHQNWLVKLAHEVTHAAR
jgi:hypothetical protein